MKRLRLGSSGRCRQFTRAPASFLVWHCSGAEAHYVLSMEGYYQGALFLLLPEAALQRGAQGREDEGPGAGRGARVQRETLRNPVSAPAWQEAERRGPREHKVRRAWGAEGPRRGV